MLYQDLKVGYWVKLKKASVSWKKTDRRYKMNDTSYYKIISISAESDVSPIEIFNPNRNTIAFFQPEAILKVASKETNPEYYL